MKVVLDETQTETKKILTDDVKSTAAVDDAKHMVRKRSFLSSGNFCDIQLDINAAFVWTLQ